MPERSPSSFFLNTLFEIIGCRRKVVVYVDFALLLAPDSNNSLGHFSPPYVPACQLASSAPSLALLNSGRLYDCNCGAIQSIVAGSIDGRAPSNHRGLLRRLKSSRAGCVTLRYPPYVLQGQKARTHRSDRVTPLTGKYSSRVLDFVYSTTSTPGSANRS